MPVGTRRRGSRSRYRLPVIAPYRLDLTAAVLRRSPANTVDVAAADGVYRRAFRGEAGVVTASVTQSAPDALDVRIDGPARAHPPTLAALQRMLGTAVDVAPFLRSARRIAWLAPLARRMRGVHPPRYPTLWEACANGVVFQQISLLAAGAMMRRLIDAASPPVSAGRLALRPFPGPAAVAALGADGLGQAGLSGAKIATLLGLAGAFERGEIDEAWLAAAPSAEAAERLRTLKGIGPWTAALVLLRGLGRLDVFPAKDSGAARGLVALAGSATAATDDVLEILGNQRGMLYFHLLLARLDARGELPGQRMQ